MVVRHKNKLLGELDALKLSRFDEIDSAQLEIEHHSATIEGFKKYVDEVIEKGTDCDIARTASSLHSRTDELLTLDSIE